MEEFGRERVVGYVSEAMGRGASSEEIVSGLLAEVHAFGQSQDFADDVTVMVVRRLADQESGASS